MSSRTTLMILFAGVFLAMTWVTVIASLDRSVFEAGDEIWNDPWARATLFDAYFGFLAVYLWIAWREPTAAARILWFVLVMTLGNFAISAYVLLALYRLAPGEGVGALFTRREARPS